MPLISFFSNKVSTVSLPSPSISRPDLEPKKIMDSFWAILQDNFSLHRGTFSSSKYSILDSPQGHSLGNSHISWFPSLLSFIGATTSGITSPALLTITWSFIRKSFLFISSGLWSVADETLAPPTLLVLILLLE